jgi:hypothetical protein
MDLQMQLKRALIAFAVWAALGGIALSRADAETRARADAADAAVPVRVHALGPAPVCRVHLRVELAAELRLTLACDRSCAPLRRVAEALHLPVTTRLDDCEVRNA